MSFCEHMIIRVRVCAHSTSRRIVSFDRAFHPWFSSSCNWSLMGLTHWVLTEWNRLWMASLNISAQPNVRSPCSRLRLSQHHHLAGCPRLWQESKKKKESLIDIKSVPDEGVRLIRVHSAHAQGVNASVKQTYDNDKLSLNRCLATGRLSCTSRSPTYFKWSFLFATMNHYLIIASSVCTLLNGHLILHFRTGAFCIIPNICLASMLYLQPHVPWRLILPLFLPCASLSLSNLPPVWLSLFLFQSLFPPPSTHSLSLFSVPIFLCVCVCVIFSSFLPLSMLFMRLPQIQGRVKKIIPWFSAERQWVKIEKVTFHVQF